MCSVNIKNRVYKNIFFCIITIMKENKLNQKNILWQKRKELRLSQTVLAKKIGISQQHWDRYEKGHPIPLEKVLKISKLLNISKWDLLPKEFTPPVSVSFDKELMKLILISIENLIIEKKLQFSPENKAELVLLLYEKFSKKPTNDNILIDIDSIVTKFISKQSA